MAGVLVTAILSPGYIWAQQDGLTASLRLSQQLENVERTGVAAARDEGTRSKTALDFRLGSTTRYQSLIFDGGTNLIYNFSDPDGIETENTRARLQYRLSSRRSEFDAAASYRRSELEDVIFDVEDIDEDLIVEDDLIDSTGIQERTSFSTGLLLGKDAPLSFRLRYAYNRSEFSDLAPGSTLNDSTTQNLETEMTFRVSPVLSANLLLSRRDRDEEGLAADDTIRDQVLVGASYAVSPATQVTASVSYFDNISDTPAGRISEDGLGYALGLAQARPNGQISVDVSSQVTINGGREQISFGRSLNFKRGSASVALGAVRFDNGDTKPLVNAALDYELDQLSTIALSFGQSAIVTNNDQGAVFTRASVAYDRTLTSRSSLLTSLQLVEQDLVGPAATDTDVVRFNLQYRYGIDRDWDLISSYSYTSNRSPGSLDRDTSRIFVGIERSFDFRP